ncbi:MAG: hypothetical protein IPN76_19130 [Saprospiraceae bacterium]|nr:hypothetical protein [Saprospiraceae bacterium]
MWSRTATKRCQPSTYYHCYKALTDPDSLRWFEALRTLMRTQHASLPPNEVKDLYLVAINYCIGRSNRGERAFLQEAFELYKEGLATKAFLENNLLSRFTYNNIVLAGLILKDFNWVEHFITEYRPHRAKIPGEHLQLQPRHILF